MTPNRIGVKHFRKKKSFKWHGINLFCSQSWFCSKLAQWCLYNECGFVQLLKSSVAHDSKYAWSDCQNRSIIVIAFNHTDGFYMHAEITEKQSFTHQYTSKYSMRIAPLKCWSVETISVSFIICRQKWFWSTNISLKQECVYCLQVTTPRIKQPSAQ